MKVDIPDEMYDALLAMANEMVSQDSRSTAMPFMFQIETEQQVAAYPGCGEEIWVSEDGEIEFSDYDEVREYILQEFKDNWEDDIDDSEVEIKAKEKLDNMDDDECEEWITDRGFYIVNVETKKKYINTFFTAKACDEHIRLNHYHYNNPRSYLNHAWRNPEMDLVTEFLKHISTAEPFNR